MQLKDLEASKGKALELRVVLDTNAIYSAGGGHLLSLEMSELVKGTVSDQHLQVLWFVPDVVLAERHYQINKQVATLQSSVAKLERVLRRPFALKDEEVEQCITASINTQLEEHKLQVCSSDHSRIDRAALIDRAVSRAATFRS